MTALLEGDNPGDKFGNSIAIYGQYIAIGAPEFGAAVGAVYIYKEVSSRVWERYDVLNPTRLNSQFGYSVAMWETTLAVGAVGYRAGTYKPAGVPEDNSYGWASIYEWGSDEIKYAGGFVTEIESPIDKKLSYFGVRVGLSKDKLIVGADGVLMGNNTGGAFVYFRNSARARSDPTAWALNYSLPSPAGFQGHFGYSVDVCDDYAVSGAYAFDDLRGSVYLVSFPKPTLEPTLAPVLAPTDNAGQSLSTVTTAIAKQKKMMEILAIGILALVGALTSACCIYLCCIPPAPLKKKKKEEEEESPYTVHSYTGYSEMDEYLPPPVPAPQWMPFFPQMPPMMMAMPPPVFVPPPPMMSMEKKKMDEKDMDLKKADENFVRKLFPYKVYSYRGYEEDKATEGMKDAAIREKKESDKSGGSSGDESEESSGSSGSNDVYAPVNISAYRPASMYPQLETISEHEEEDRSTSSEEKRMAHKMAQYDNGNQGQQQPQRRGLPYTYSSQYSMQGYQNYNSQQNMSQFFQPGQPQYEDSSDSSVSSLTSLAKKRYANAAQQNSGVSSSDSSYVSMAKQQYARFKQQSSNSVGSNNDADDVSIASYQSETMRPSMTHSERVRQYALERGSDLYSSTDDSFVARAKQRYMQFLTKKNMTKEEREAEDLLREQSFAFLREDHVQPTTDDATVSTMTETVASNRTGNYTEASDSTYGTGSAAPSQRYQSFGALNLRPTSTSNVVAEQSDDESEEQPSASQIPTVTPEPIYSAPAPVPVPIVQLKEAAIAAPPVSAAKPAAHTLFKASSIERQGLKIEEVHLKLSKKIEFEELEEIKEVQVPLRQNSGTSLLASKPVAVLPNIEERELATIREINLDRPRVLARASSAQPQQQAVEHLAHELEDARQKTIDELERARALAQTMAAEEELKRVQERNRLKEETRLRAEERARAQFALHKQKAEATARANDRTADANRSQVVSAAEAILAAERAIQSVQMVQANDVVMSNNQSSNRIVNNSTTTTTTTNVVRTTTTNVTINSNNVISSQSPSTSNPSIEEP